MLTAQMLLGGAGSQIGWLIFGFGSIFLWLIGWHADLTDWRFSASRFVQTIGESAGCQKTGYSEGGSRGRNGTPVYRNLYQYTVDGQSFEASAYDTGRCVASGPVMVEYLRDRPDVSRISGMRRDVFGPWAALVAVFPAVGLIMLALSVARGRSRVQLLRTGTPGSGKLVEKAATATRINNRTVYRMTFEYVAQDGTTRRVVTKTHLPERLEDEEAEFLLYDPANPSSAVMFDSLPGTVTVDDAGQPQARSRAFLILPILAILGNLWWLSRR